MKTDITIVGSNGVVSACLHLKGIDANWRTVTVTNDLRSKSFRICSLYELTIATEEAQFVFLPGRDPNTWPLIDRIKWCFGGDLHEDD